MMSRNYLGIFDFFKKSILTIAIFSITTSQLFADVDGHPMIYQQEPSGVGPLSIEAENYHAQANGNSWDTLIIPGMSAGKALHVPDAGVNLSTVNIHKNPRLDYQVNFVKKGTYYVWVRGKAANGRNDSIHIGLNNKHFESSDKISKYWPYGELHWANKTMDGPVATVEVTSAGIHTVNAWQREDGFIFDKLILTLDPTYTPEAYGPLETPRTRSGENITRHIKRE